MPQKSETPAGSHAVAWCNQLGGWLREPDSPASLDRQVIPSVISRHVGADFLATWERTTQ